MLLGFPQVSRSSVAHVKQAIFQLLT